MSRYCFRLLIALIVCSLASLPVPHFAEANSCGNVEDGSSMAGSGNCGDTYWDLTAEWGGGVPAHYEDDWAYGACDGGYYNCSSVYVVPGQITASEHFYDDGPLGDEEEMVHWTLDSWTVSFASCNNGNPNDQQENISNDPSETPEFEVDCV
jgi:hypothetical protein